MFRKTKAERKLEYLQKYMNRWIDHYPVYKVGDFEVFYDLELRKDKKRRQKEIEANKARKPKVTSGRVCQYCERPFWWHQIQKTRDHIVPKVKGGGGRDNLINCCYDCNQWKGSKDLSEWLAEALEYVVSGRFPKGYNQQFVSNIVVNIRKVQQFMSKPAA